MMLFQIQPANDGTGGRPCQSGERRWPVCWEPQEELSTLSPSALTTPSASVPLLLVFWAFQEQTGVSLNVMSHYILSPLGPGKVSVLMAQVWIDT